MDNKEYYDFMAHGVDWGEKGISLNEKGFVTFDNIPFYNVGDAVKYIMQKYPGIDAKSKPIKYDKKACKAAAKTLEPEIRRFVDFIIEDELNKKHKAIDILVDESNKLSDLDLIESVHKSVLRDEIYRKSGEFSGLIAASQILRERLLEFISISSIKDG